MTGAALDTNRLSDLFRGDAELAAALERCEQVWIPLIVLGELQAGFLAGDRTLRNEALLRSFLTRPNVRLLLPNRDTARYYAETLFYLRRAGTPIPTNDIWIAALALQHDLPLFTRDRHFARIPGLIIP